jgi:hypothetical protein
MTDTYGAEQMDRIRRVGKEMRSAAPITSRKLPKIDSKLNQGPVKGGPVSEKKK